MIQTLILASRQSSDLMRPLFRCRTQFPVPSRHCIKYNLSPYTHPIHLYKRVSPGVKLHYRFHLFPTLPQVLVVSPQNIDDDVLTLLADSRVRHLYLFQNRYTPAAIAISPCSVRGWRLLRRDNPNLRVHLRAESTSGAAEILLQPEPAPVHSMIYQSPRTMVSHRGWFGVWAG